MRNLDEISSGSSAINSVLGRLMYWMRELCSDQCVLIVLNIGFF